MILIAPCRLLRWKNGASLFAAVFRWWNRHFNSALAFSAAGASADHPARSIPAGAREASRGGAVRGGAAGEPPGRIAILGAAAGSRIGPGVGASGETTAGITIGGAG